MNAHTEISVAQAVAAKTGERQYRRSPNPIARLDSARSDTGASPMETTSSLITVPLKKLSLSGANVRKSNRDEDIEGLAADILERGLDQNLIVIRDPGTRGAYEVVAGGRRYLALRRLQAERRITANFDVPVKLIEPENARAASLAENIQRVAMNPADEILAFAEIVAEHADQKDPIAYCARRTGRSRDVVEQRLRLAKLPAQILDALRAGTIGLSAATAYAAVADPELQLQIFRAEEARAFGEKHRPGNIRDTLKGRTLPANCSQILYVGMDAYLAAGGRVDRDLFMGADVGEQLLDPTLLNDLAREKAEDQLRLVVEQTGFGQGILTKTFSPLPVWPSTPAGFRIGGQVSDPRAMEALPAFAVRPTAIGVFTLRGAYLSCIGYFAPIVAPAAVLQDPAKSSAEAPSMQAQVPFVQEARAGEHILAAPNFRPGEALRQEALRLAAGRIVVEHVAPSVLEERVCFPQGPSFIPPITTAIGDDDTFLVAVQIRVPRAELEAAMPEAVQQLEDGEQANERVAAAAAEAA